MYCISSTGTSFSLYANAMAFDPLFNIAFERINKRLRLVKDNEIYILRPPAGNTPCIIFLKIFHVLVVRMIVLYSFTTFVPYGIDISKRRVVLIKDHTVCSF